MSGRHIRHQFVGEFRSLGRKSTTTAALTIISYVCQIAASSGLGYYLLQLPLSAATGAMLALLALFTGTRIRGLNNIVHECSHFSFCDSRNANMLFGSLCASILLNCFRDYREEHLSHHAHLGDYENDQDFKRLRSLRLEDPLTAATVSRHVLTALAGLHLPYYVNINLGPRDGRFFLAMKLGLISAAVMLLIVAPLEAAVLIWFPFLWVFPAINYLTDCIDHGGLIDAGDELDASRNLPVPTHLRVLFFPRNDCYHLVHHLFPQVPADHLAECHSRLLSHPEYRERAKVPVLGPSIADRAAGTKVPSQRRALVSERSRTVAKQLKSAAGLAN